MYIYIYPYDSVFVCHLSDVFHSSDEYFTHIKTQHCRCRPAEFDLYSALKDIGYWRFFSVPHRLWYGLDIRLKGSVIFPRALSNETPLPFLNCTFLLYLIIELFIFRRSIKSKNGYDNPTPWTKIKHLDDIFSIALLLLY